MTGKSDNMRAALLTLAAMTGYTLNDSFLKALSDELSLAQTLLLRGIGVTSILLVAGRATGGLHWPRLPADRGWIVLRSLCEASATFFFVTALFHMPIANATAILQAVPLTVTLGAALMFGEALGWRRLTAIAVGFAGMLLIVRPGTEGFDSHALYAVAAVVLITLRDLASRKMSPAVSSLLVATAGSFVVTVAFGVVAALEPWTPVSPKAALQLLGAIVTIFCGYFCSVAAVRVGEIGAVAPLRYAGLVVALIVGLVVFDEWPGPVTLLGAGIVVATGLFTLLRERALARRHAD